MQEDLRRWDADADAASLSTPTLLIHERNNANVTMATTRRVAGLIKDSRVAFIDNAFEGALLAQRFFDGDAPDAAEPASKRADAPPEADIVHTILFTDVEGSTALTERLGDAKARDLLREHDGIVREALKAHGGLEVKTMGDGFMTSFSSATKALECAIAIQRSFEERNESAAEPIKVRIGLNAGEPIAEDDDLYGTVVNLAARIAAQAAGGEILASEAVHQIVAGKKFPFSDRGETALRGFEDRVHIYQVSWREE
jgi:class 3 adenylate cyclase